MATNNLEVKFKVETSDLRKGSTDAKRTVKDTADQMARDVKGAAQDMASSMGRVNDATKQIADAANTASGGIRSLEQNVARSASSMERNLSRVSRQMSAMQLFHMGARGATMIGGAAANIARLNGNTAAAEGIDSATGILVGGMQGAAMGSYFGPWGTAIGALVGAGTGLIDAAVKQKEAAEKQLEAARAQVQQSKQTIESIDAEVQSRNRSQRAETIANMPMGAFDEKFAQGEIDKAKRALQIAESRQNQIQDMLYGRHNVSTEVADWGSLLGLGAGAKYVALPDGSLLDLERDMPQNLGVVNWMEPGKENSVTDMIARAVELHTTRPTWSNTFGPEGNERDEYGNLKGDSSFYYTMNWLANRFGLGFERSEFFQKLTSTIFQTLEAKALDAATQVAEAQKRLSELAPIQARLDREAADSARRMAEPFNFEEAEDFTQEPRAWTEPVDKETLKAGMQQLRDFTSLLNGVVSGAGFSSPTDALTRIGGGRGYASYNDSAARVQMRIEASLRTLIKNQTDQNNEILHAIENISVSDPDIAWQQEQ